MKPGAALRIASCAAALAAAGAAESGLQADVLGLARDGGVLRVVLHRDAAPGDGAGGPVRIHAELRDGAAAIAQTDAAIASLAQLAGGATLVLVPERAGRGRLQLVATVARAGQPPLLETATAMVATPGSVLAEAAAATARLRDAGEQDPLPWLWAEQAADCAAGGATADRVGEVAAIARRLGDWADGRRPPPPGPGTSLQAFRDPVDGSVQPYRLHLPAGSGPFPFALLLPESGAGPSKADWPLPPARWLAAAAEAGVAVIECYPAGDRAWNGAALRRIPLALAAAQRLVSLDGEHGAVVGPAADARLPYAAHDREHAGEAAWWRTLPGPPHQAAPAAADASAVFAAPFTIVVGAGEHAAARAWNRELADALRAAYATHAHAIPPACDDLADPAGLAGRNLVLIGNPRSNRMLAALGLRLPFAWDHRQVRGPDGFIAMRAARPALACIAALPGGRLALVLDGSPPPWGEGLPLAGLPLPWAAAGR